ncbi:MAG: sulfite exporter TauE/SafE family protein [Ilumatobacteraceae bacterium]
MHLDQYIVVACIVLFAAVVQSISGFGFALMSVPLMVVVIDLRIAVVVSALVGTISTSGQAWHMRNERDRVLTRRFIVSSCIGAPFGLAAFIWVPQDVLKVVLGIAVLFGVAVLSRGLDMRTTHHSFDWLMGVLSGVLLMATSTNGPPLVFTLHARRINPQVFRATLNAVFAATGVVSTVLFIASGKVTVQVLTVSAIAVPVMILGVYLGILLRRIIAPERFRLIVLTLLAISGASSIVSVFI